MNEAELLLSSILNCGRNYLYFNKDKKLSRENLLFISSALKRRFQWEPLQYILGESEFMGLTFKVTGDVLIPRPETEILVETAVKIANGIWHMAYGKAEEGKPVSILDIGTGSGCIAVSLAKLLPGVEITGVDISEEALSIARINAELNKVSETINFLQGDLFGALTICHTPYALCVSNPPYIRSSDIDELAPEVQFEPRIALDGGEDGLDFYRKIISSAPLYLKEGGYLILEMGFNQRSEVTKILQNSLNFEIIEVVKDYGNIERVIVARKIWIN